MEQRPRREQDRARRRSLPLTDGEASRADNALARLITTTILRLNAIVNLRLRR